MNKYEQLYQQLEEYLRGIPEGGRLLPIRAMQAQWGVSLATLNSALQMLEHVGLIVREPYRGIFKASGRIVRAEGGDASHGEGATVTLLLPGWADKLFQSIITVCSRLLYERDIRFNLCIYDVSVQSELEHLRHFTPRVLPNGLIYMPSFDTAAIRSEVLRLSQRCPIVQIDRFLGGDLTPTVSYALFDSAYRATEALIRAGRRRIGLVRPLTLLPGQKERIDGFHAALNHYGIPLDATRNVIFDAPLSGTATDLELTFGRLQPPDGFFATNSVYLGSLFRRLMALGKKVPEDVAITCFDLTDTFANLPVEVTHVEEPVSLMMTKAVECLLSMIAHPESRPPSIELPCRLIPGKSCPVLAQKKA